MSLSLTSNTSALKNALYTYFQGSGGTAPYSYAVLAGGVGGTINSSSGLYTAPVTGTGQDTVEVTDNVGAKADATILVCNALELLCDVIQHEMSLSQGQIYLWDSKIIIPNDFRLYIAVGVLSCKPFANTCKFNGDGTATESVNMLANCSIDIFSRGPDARDRKEEVILALNSIYSQSQQEINSFYIGKISTSFVNLSEIDGAAIPYRFNISVALQYFTTNVKAVPYYNTFQTTQVTTEP